MANKVDEILTDVFDCVDGFARVGDAHVAANLRRTLEDLKTAIAEERKIPPRNTAKLFEEIQEINACLDQPDAIPLIRGHVYAALSSRPRVCDMNSIEALTVLVVKTFLANDYCKDLSAQVKAIIEAAIKASLKIAYEPATEVR